MKTYFDTDGDNNLSRSEAAAVTSISVPDKEITTLEGIEYFTNLEDLECSKNTLGRLDLSSNSKLKALLCENCGLTELKVNGCKWLEVLDCSGNQLSTLDLSKNIVLQMLNVSYNNGLSALDLNRCPDLKTL